MKIQLAILILLFSSQVLAQIKEMEFGKISTQEIEMTGYEKDKEAKAVVLYDKGKSMFFYNDDGYDVLFTRHKRIKIFDKSASQYAEISIPYYVDGFGKTELVYSIEAITYNLKNGSLVHKKLDPSTIYEERINERWFNKKFVFPDVQDGSILEFRYTLETPFHFNLPDWTFQDKIPTIYSEYEVRMIPFYEYVFIAQGISKFDYQNSFIAKEKRSWGSVTKVYGRNVGNGLEFQDYVHTYVLMDVSAFKDESYITSINDYIIKMDFQLAKFHSPYGGTSDIISTWPALNKALLKHDKFGKYLKSSSRFARKIIEEELEVSGLDVNEKVKKIIEYVNNSFEWDGYYSKYTSQSVKDFINKKNGNTADINLFLISLLNEADIEAQPLILSTRNHGKIYFDYPFDSFTNYVIALVNVDSPFLADGTEDFLPYNRIPTRCFNGKGLIVNEEDESEWISLKSNILSLDKKVITLTIDTLTFNTKARVSVQSTEYESFSIRKRFRDDTLKIKEYYSDKPATINRIKTINYYKASIPYSIIFEVIYETEKIGNTLVIKPLLKFPPSENHLTQKKRSYPVDFIYTCDEQFESIIEIPRSFGLSTLPESYNLDNDLVEINLNYTYADRTLIAKGNYKFKKAVYLASEYSRIKYYLDQIVKYFNQPIIVEINN